MSFVEYLTKRDNDIIQSIVLDGGLRRMIGTRDFDNFAVINKNRTKSCKIKNVVKRTKTQNVTIRVVKVSCTKFTSNII